MDLFTIYSKMPLFAQNVLLSLQGSRLKKQRYNKTYFEILDFLNSTSNWNTDQIKSYKEEKTFKIIEHAFKTCPYYKDKYSVNFETGSEDVILTQFVDKNGTVKEPIEPTKDGYIFKEWQLNGVAFDFNTKLDKDIILSAEWIKEEYITVNFSTDTLEEFDEIKLLKGDTIKELPVSNNQGYEFIGWYLNDELYENQEINSDVVLVAKYKEIIHEYKIGDKIKIIGNYAKMSTDKIAYNKRAIGWERQILNIIEGVEFPYVIGDNTGVTGFFKVESLERV